MALVLWEPPNKHLRIMHTPRNTPTISIPNSSDDNNNAMSDEEGNNNNNNETVHDFNQVRLENNITSTYEPMDL